MMDMNWNFAEFALQYGLGEVQDADSSGCSAVPGLLQDSSWLPACDKARC